jgi:biopolymer transport protein ExbD/biopolymer transport protein TolR
MGARRSRSSSSELPEPDINVTPLVDVVLVLLIIFMVITPALNEGEHVELPAILQTDQKKKEMDPIELTVAMNGVIVLEKEHIQESELDARLEALHGESPDRKLMIKADTHLGYGKIREHFARAQDIGFSGIKLKVTKRKEPGESGA